MFYRGYKNHVLVDCITGLPIFKLTAVSNVSDCTVALDVLSQTNKLMSVNERTFIVIKAYDVKSIYYAVNYDYVGECVIPLNKRETKNCKNFQADIQSATRALLYTRTENLQIVNAHVKNIAVLLNLQNPRTPM